MSDHNIRVDEIHERKITVRLDKDQLQDLILGALGKKLGFNPMKPGIEAKLSFEEQTEGSPAYRVGTKLTVTITEDLMPQPAVERAA